MAQQFFKMHGLGNDFIVFDATRQPFTLSAAQARALADRRTGVGCDQVLILEAPRQADTVAWYRIFNTDGSEAAQCGNGARCLALHWAETHSGQTEFRLQCSGGVVDAKVTSPQAVSISLPAPSVGAPAEFPWRGETWPYLPVSVGNPHAVLQVPDAANAPVAELGLAMQQSAAFADGVNVEFMEIRSPDHIRLRVFERGVGETQACGSGACAAAVAGLHNETLKNPVRIDLPGGQLMVSWRSSGEPIWLTGPAARVFEGILDL